MVYLYYKVILGHLSFISIYFSNADIRPDVIEQFTSGLIFICRATNGFIEFSLINFFYDLSIHHTK